jgi:hypothetical protein
MERDILSIYNTFNSWGIALRLEVFGPEIYGIPPVRFTTKANERVNPTDRYYASCVQAHQRQMFACA